MNQLVEFIVLGKPLLVGESTILNASLVQSTRTFALAPGLLPMRLAAGAGALAGGGFETPDAIDLPDASTILYLTSGRADWLSGRFIISPFATTSSDVIGLGSYYSANWDMAEVERDWKDLIIQNGGLLNKLYIPRP